MNLRMPYHTGVLMTAVLLLTACSTAAPVVEKPREPESVSMVTMRQEPRQETKPEAEPSAQPVPSGTAETDGQAVATADGSSSGSGGAADGAGGGEGEGSMASSGEGEASSGGAEGGAGAADAASTEAEAVADASDMPTAGVTAEAAAEATADGAPSGGAVDAEAMPTTSVRREERAAILVAPDLPPAPIELALQQIVVPRADPRTAASELSLLAGRWRQEKTDNRADFAEGGYTAREMRIEPDGRIIITMQFDSGMTVVRQYRCEAQDQKFTIKPVSISKEDEEKAKKAIVILPPDAKPAEQTLPLSLTYDLATTTLRLGEKTYRFVDKK